MDWLILKLRNGRDRKKNFSWVLLPMYLIQSYQKKSGIRAELLCQSYLDQVVKELEETGPRNGFLYERDTLGLHPLDYPLIVVKKVM